MFDVDKFIECVHEKSAIWNKRSKEYSNKILRERCWVEIGEHIYANWELLSCDERDEKVKEMKNKWRHIRDNYNKFMNQRSTDDGRKKKKKYVYSEALHFLLNTITIRKETPDDYNVVFKFEEDEEEEEDKFEETESFILASPPSSTAIGQRQLIQPSELAINPLSQPQEKFDTRTSQGADDADKLFLMSLLPDFRKLNGEEKIDFKMNALNFFKNIHRKRKME